MNAKLSKLAAARFGASFESLQPLAGGHFSNVYEYSSQGQARILRITPPNEEIGPREMLAILEWVDYLSTHGAPVASPLRSQDHRLLETIELDGRTFLVASFEKAPGILGEELPIDQWDETLVRKLGAAAGRMHAIARVFLPADEAFMRPEWDQAVNCFNPGESLDSAQAGVQEKRSKILLTAKNFSRDRGDYGMIHADFHGGNFFVDVERERITVFDFDDCCYGWYAMDIAMSLFDALVLYRGSDPQQFGTWFLENYLLGYDKENRLDPVWIERLPLFLKLLETGVYTQVYRFYDGSGEDAWVGKFMPGRKERIAADLPYIDLDFSGIYRGVLAKNLSEK